MSTLKSIEVILVKAAMVGAVGAVGSIVFLDGNKQVDCMGHKIPTYLAHGGGLFLSSAAASYIVPMVTPWAGQATPGSILAKFENATLIPMVVAASSLAVESVLCPESLKDSKNIVAVLAYGGLSEITASYVMSSFGI